MVGIAIPVTLTVAAACALINLWLQVRVGQVRRRERVFVGDGNSEPLVRRMRAQANFVENAPFVLVLILALELTTGTSMWLWAAGGAFLLGRLAHPFGMDGVRSARMVGTLLTMVVLAGLAVWAARVAYEGGGSPRTITIDTVATGAR